MFIDVHCHIEMIEKPVSEIVKNAKKNGVEKILASAVHPGVTRKVLEWAEEFKEIKPSLGIYPIEALEMGDEKVDEEIKFMEKNKNKFVCIGEVGLEMKEAGAETLESQKKTFGKFIDLSMKIDKPILVHSRKGEKESIELLEEKKAKKVIMHCFFGKRAFIERIVKNGWYLTVPTCVKHNVQMQELVKIAPIENLLCETDSPFMHPDRNDLNEPANVVESYKKIAEIKGISLKECEKKIEENYKRLFEK